MGPPTGTLASLEVSVRGRGRSLPWLQLVRVHPQAHGTTRVAPLSPEGFENLVQPFRFCLQTNPSRTWNNQNLDLVSLFMPCNNISNRTQVLTTAVSARANKDGVYRNLPQWSTSLQPHVLQGPFSCESLGFVIKLLWVGDFR